MDPLHRLFICDSARAVIDLVVVAVEGRDRRNVIAFAIGLLLRGHRLLDRLRPRLQRRGIGRVPKRVPMAHRHTPIAHRTLGLDRGDRDKGLDRLVVPEGVQNPDSLIEFLLRRRAAGDRKIHLAEFRLGSRFVPGRRARDGRM